MANKKTNNNLAEKCQMCGMPLNPEIRSKNDPNLCKYCGEDKPDESK